MIRSDGVNDGGGGAASLVGCKTVEIAKILVMVMVIQMLMMRPSEHDPTEPEHEEQRYVAWTS